MKKLLTFVLAAAVVAAIAPAAFAQVPCLFFSEYGEGSSYNKFIEIYNNTGADIDLSRVELQLWSNGTATVTSTDNSFTGTLAAGDVFVVCGSNATINPALLALSDAISGTVNWNGDDTIVLLLDGVTVDVFGQFFFDPGSAWTSGEVTTVNQTLIRGSDVCCGDPNGNDEFDPAIEWIAFAVDYWDNVGMHTTTCLPVDNAPTSWGSVKGFYR